MPRYMRVLIVEDDADLCELLCLLLADTPETRCTAVRSFSELKERSTEAREADLAILDVNLGPGVPSGVDVYDWLQRQGFAGHVIFLTGHAGSHPLVQRARSIAGTDVLQKPVEAEALLALVGHEPEEQA